MKDPAAEKVHVFQIASALTLALVDMERLQKSLGLALSLMKNYRQGALDRFEQIEEALAELADELPKAARPTSAPSGGGDPASGAEESEPSAMASSGVERNDNR
jgi:hypothetical protein